MRKYCWILWNPGNFFTVYREHLKPLLPHSLSHFPGGVTWVNEGSGFGEEIEIPDMCTKFQIFLIRTQEGQYFQKTKGCAVMQKSSTCYWWVAPKCSRHRNTMETNLSKSVDYILWSSLHKCVVFIPIYLIFSLNAQTLAEDSVRLRNFRQPLLQHVVIYIFFIIIPLDT